MYLVIDEIGLFSRTPNKYIYCAYNYNLIMFIVWETGGTCLQDQPYFFSGKYIKNLQLSQVDGWIDHVLSNGVNLDLFTLLYFFHHIMVLVLSSNIFTI